ncbi:MAG: hypothetical protein U1D30_17270 [Planctomycetota bacterium]
MLWKADFESGELAGWKMTDAKAWRIEKTDMGKSLTLFRQSNHKPKVRSPLNYALLEDLPVTDFTLDVKLQSTARDYGHRDLCLFFGFQDPEHFYYVHLGKEADPHAHSVFLVNGAPRLSIAKERTEGTPWTDGWHHVRLKRNAESGDIEVFFDNMDKPVMKANDKTFTWGTVGIGSFDDTGRFDDIVLRGMSHKKE